MPFTPTAPSHLCWLACAALLAPVTPALAQAGSGAGSITEATLTDPTQRYRHFVLGRDFEPSSLVARLADGRTLKLALPADQVFEDRAARVADLDGDGRNEVVVVRSSLSEGSAVVVVGARDGALRILAAGPATGGPNRWLNPAGIADFDGDGRLDIAFVQQPHVLGRLRVLTYSGGRLVEIAALGGVSNHVAGSAELGLSAVADFNGDGVADLAVPSFDRRTLRFITFRGGAREFSARPLPAPAASGFRVVQGAQGPAVDVGLADNRRIVIAP